MPFFQLQQGLVVLMNRHCALVKKLKKDIEFSRTLYYDLGKSVSFSQKTN